eukprot:16318568-Heterocapsa_arctica.AAC.1
MPKLQPSRPLALCPMPASRSSWSEGDAQVCWCLWLFAFGQLAQADVEIVGKPLVRYCDADLAEGDVAVE